MSSWVGGGDDGGGDDGGELDEDNQSAYSRAAAIPAQRIPAKSNVCEAEVLDGVFTRSSVACYHMCGSLSLSRARPLGVEN